MPEVAGSQFIRKYSGDGRTAREWYAAFRNNLLYAKTSRRHRQIRADALKGGNCGSLKQTELKKLIKEYDNLTFLGLRASKNPINLDIAFDLEGNLPKI